MEKLKHVSIKFPKELHYKLYFIAKYEGRSGNGHILYLIRQNIKKFEEENGEIKIEEQEK